MAIDPRLARVQSFYENLTPASLESDLASVYMPDAQFKDPFNEVTGIEAIRRIFRTMYQQVDSPRFIVTASAHSGNEAFLAWQMMFRLRRPGAGERIIRGATHIQFSVDGRVANHRDYWDAAEELYEKLPMVGTLMRWLKRRAQH
jgi:steroid Delta-isomerase